MNKAKEEQPSQGRTWTEEQRLALAAKLDSELNEFIDNLEKKRYNEGWPEDRWQEEMAKHPFFMKQEPKPGDEVHPMLEGLQKLKYDPEENTKEELAENYKEDGNFYMKHKKFRLAVYSYTEGIKIKCQNSQLEAVLYNNRSAAHFFIKNYRSALSDAQKAIILKKNYAKARWRAAQCAYCLEKFDLCNQLCNELLEVDQQYVSEATELLKKNKIKRCECERNRRKEVCEGKKRSAQFEALCRVLRERNVKFDDQTEMGVITKQLLRPKFLPLEDFPVQLDKRDNTTLLWPVAFSYPEFLLSDFQQQCAENVCVEDILKDMFVEPIPDDKDDCYRPNSLNVYYENRKFGSVHKVDVKKSLKEVINEKSFFVSGGTLLFYIVPIGSQIEQKFIQLQRRPTVYALKN